MNEAKEDLTHHAIHLDEPKESTVIEGLKDSLDQLAETYLFHKHCCFCNYPFMDEDNSARDMTCPKCAEARKPKVVIVPQ